MCFIFSRTAVIRGDVGVVRNAVVTADMWGGLLRRPRRM